MLWVSTSRLTCDLPVCGGLQRNAPPLSLRHDAFAGCCRMSAMVTREWIIKGREPRIVQLDCRIIDGVSHTLTYVPGLSRRYELLPTELIPHLPRLQWLKSDFYARLVFALLAIGILCGAAFNVRWLMRRFSISPEEEP